MWKHHSLPPSWLEERTPHELLFLFGTQQADEVEETESFDRVAELRRINENRAPHDKPIIPEWLMPELPRVRK